MIREFWSFKLYTTQESTTIAEQFVEDMFTSYLDMELDLARRERQLAADKEFLLTYIAVPEFNEELDLAERERQLAADKVRLIREFWYFNFKG